jgi:hypothetical protein
VIEAMESAIAARELNPMRAKRALGRALVTRHRGAAAAEHEDEWFSRVFSGRAVPADAPAFAVADPERHAARAAARLPAREVGE